MYDHHDIIIWSIRYPELLFDLTGIGLRIQSVHLIVNWAQLIGWNRCVTAETRLQDGVVDEDVLLLVDRQRGERWRHLLTSPHLLTSSLLCLLSGLIDRWTVAEMSLHKWFMSTHTEEEAEEQEEEEWHKQMADINRQTEKVMAASISVTSCQSLFDDITELQQNNNNSVLPWRLNTVFVNLFLSCGRILWCHSSGNLWPLATKM